MHEEVKKRVEAGTALYTDELLSYEGLAGEYAHKVINHAVQYVDGAVHTNTMESAFSLLKRAVNRDVSPAFDKALAALPE